MPHAVTATIVLLFLTGFVGLAFGWRSWLQWRRTGSTGFVGTRHGASVTELLGIVAPATAFLLLALAPLADFAGLGRIALLDNWPTALAGMVLDAAGLVLTIMAQLAMGDSWRIGVEPSETTDLVTTGLFNRVRNPIFTAMFLVAIGIALLVPNLISVVAAIILIIGLNIQVRLIEEPHLRQVHGARYNQYQRTTGRFVPRIRQGSGSTIS